MMRQLGGGSGLAIVVAVFTATGSYHSAMSFGDGVSIAIGASAAFSLAGALAALMLPSRRAGHRAEPPAHAFRLAPIEPRAARPALPDHEQAY